MLAGHDRRRGVARQPVAGGEGLVQAARFLQPLLLQLGAQVRAMPAGGGLNALTGEFGDMLEGGVIDPVRVTRSLHSARPLRTGRVVRVVGLTGGTSTLPETVEAVRQRLEEFHD